MSTTVASTTGPTKVDPPSISDNLASSRAASAPVPIRSDRSRVREFRRVFNLVTIAAAFYVTLLFVLANYVPWLYSDETFSEWGFFIAYITRQHLISALLVLFALGIAEAWLPRSLPPLGRLLGVSALTGIAVAISAIARMSLARGAFDSDVALAAWFISILTLWTTIGMLFAVMLWASRRTKDLGEQLLNEQAAHDGLVARALEARLSVLQAQIEPHFLFNTLANVRRLHETDPERGRRMMASLLEYLHAALPSMRGSGNSLARELDLVRSYLTILQLRLGERLRFAIDASTAAQSANLPPMLLATLVENAIKHGLSPLTEGGEIRITARVDPGAAGDGGAALVVAVADTGQGFVASSGTGVGLANSRARLAALYGDRGRLSLRANEPRGVVAEIRMPFMQATAQVAATQDA